MSRAGQAYVDSVDSRSDAGRAHVSTGAAAQGRPGPKPHARKTAEAARLHRAQKVQNKKGKKRYYLKLQRGSRQVDVRADLQARDYNRTGFARMRD